MQGEQNSTADQIQRGDHQFATLAYTLRHAESPQACKPTPSHSSAASSMPRFPHLKGRGVGLGGL